MADLNTNPTSVQAPATAPSSVAASASANTTATSHDADSVADSDQATSAGITASIVPGSERMAFLPRVFGNRWMMPGEAAVYSWMSRLCPDYSGGFWEFVDLSNGGFYLQLASDKHFAVRVDGNGFCGALSADAASIVSTLFAINQLLFQGAGHLEDAYYALRDYGAGHAEARRILQAID